MTETPDPAPIFELDTVGIRARGQARDDGKFVVLAGSQARAEVTESYERHVPSGYRKHRERLIAEGVLQLDPENDELKFMRDEVFNGTTEAGCVVAGRMVNGIRDWVTYLPDGKKQTHADWLSQEWEGGDTPIFTLKSTEVKAYGQMRQGEFVVLAGSQSKPGTTSAMDHGDQRLKEELLQRGALQAVPESSLLEFSADTPFPNGTAASCVILLRPRGVSTGWYFTNQRGQEISFGEWMGMLFSIPEEVRNRRRGHSSKAGEVELIEAQVDRTAILAEVTQDTVNPLNQILYGPPGTGKTYQVVERALAILDPEFLASGPQREAMKARYDDLVAQGAVSFVTFHQSFGYEDFIEGIKPIMQGGQLSYKLQDGIFLEAVRAAGGDLPRVDDVASEPAPIAKAPEVVRSDAQVWRIYIDGTAYTSVVRERTVERGEIRVGSFGQPLQDLSTVGSDDLRGSLLLFRDGLHVGDLILLATGTDRIGAVGVVTGEYHFDPHSDVIFSQEYAHARAVKWLLTGLSLDAQTVTGRRFAPPTLQRVAGLKAGEVMAKLPQAPEQAVAHPEDTAPLGPRPHVLIIDEINRGNVAKVFGELITLLESGKRVGKPEALSVKLPLSRRPLSVPQTLYVIGTMNTADRSLTQLDTALRRRFTFHPVWPQPEVLPVLNIEGDTLDLRKFLYAMNQTVERLLSREQVIGHAYLLDIPRNLRGVASALRERILPQLEEYFFDDWAKIREVLGDQRKDTALQFIQEEKSGAEKRYHINEAAFGELEAFTLVYSHLSDDAFPFEG